MTQLSLLPLWLLREYETAIEDFSSFLAQWFPAPSEYVRNRSDLLLHPGQYASLSELMGAVKKTATPGYYLGAAMKLDRTQLAAKMSGDYNDVHVNRERPHPLFGKLIAHGMDAVTQALVALRAEIGSQQLVLHQASITFLQPVFLDEDRLYIHVTKTTPTEWRINVSAKKNQGTVERIVVKMSICLKDGTPFDEDDWFRSHMALWRISALIAETWPGALYAKQELTFHRPMAGSEVGIVIRGQGQNSRGHCEVSTEVMLPNRSLWPAITGKATIVLSKAA
jgi:hypothetical protein